MKLFTTEQSLLIHIEKCKVKLNEKDITKLELKIKNLEIELKHSIITNKELDTKHKKEILEIKNYNDKTVKNLQLQLQVDKMFLTIEKLASNAINKLHETVIDIELDDNEEKDSKEEIEGYQLQPLNLGNDFYIENREEDGYINVTNLCKAGNKKFNDWSRIDNTKAFLKELSTSAGIPADVLIQSITGGKNEDRKTWVHPYVAINIAQWISPQFDVKVSSWIYEVMLTGKIDISRTKSFQQLHLENKEHKLKIQYLTKKYVKLQPRVQYNEKNVIYILTTPSHKKEGKYILGKATNLTNRLSTYNKTDEHEVVYYHECKDEDSMSIVEQLIFHKLKDYREQANRERFILPENKTIELFIDVIKKSIENL